MIVKTAFDIIHLETGKNPVELLVRQSKTLLLMKIQLV